MRVGCQVSAGVVVDGVTVTMGGGVGRIRPKHVVIFSSSINIVRYTCCVIDCTHIPIVSGVSEENPAPVFGVNGTRSVFETYYFKTSVNLSNVPSIRQNLLHSIVRNLVT